MASNYDIFPTCKIDQRHSECPAFYFAGGIPVMCACECHKERAASVPSGAERTDR